MTAYLLANKGNAMNIEPTQTIEQAVQNIKTLPIQEQKNIFDYIDWVMFKYQTNHQPQTVSDLIHQYPAPTSFNADDVVAMQRQWRDEWE